MGFLPRVDDKEASTYQEKKDTCKKKRESIYQEVQCTSSWARGLAS
jgi:hypothetical protein